MTVERLQTNLIDPRDLLDILRQHAHAAPFNLALYSQNSGPGGLWQAVRTTCFERNEGPCTKECLHVWQEGVKQSIQSNKPIVIACPRGRLGFVVPFPQHIDLPDCLIGAGLEDRKTHLNTHVDEENHHRSMMIFEDTENLNLSPRQQADAFANEIHSTLPGLLDQQLQTVCLARTTQRLNAVREISRDLARCNNAEQALEITIEALIVLFDLPKILILLQTAKNTLTLHTTLGLNAETCKVNEMNLLEHLRTNESTPGSLSATEIEACFPGLHDHSVYLIPMTDGSRPCGVVALLDIDLHARDQALIELLVCRLASHLERLRLLEGQERERQYSTRMVSMVSSLSLISSRDKLLTQILEMSAELIGARTGSLMLLNEVEGTLTIAAAKGMSPSLARSMNVSFGQGIAGRVAKNGFPMLVNDIERDTRIASRNRPRFKTKSFISLPLHVNDRLIGVLNLADKDDNTSFSEADLNLIQTFSGHAIQMIDRATTLEQADRYEKLSVTDSLTGLYNRRFLEQRLQEEINRGQRQAQSFCVILADLDNFKIYNDICGHLAGDNTLRKAAGLMRRTAREMDVVTRYGGEEFCLILPGTSKKESVFVAERIRRGIESEAFPGETHLPLGRLTISLGIAAYPEDGQTAKELIHAADLSLYQAKSRGRNRLVLYEPSMAKHATHKQLPEQSTI